MKKFTRNNIYILNVFKYCGVGVEITPEKIGVFSERLGQGYISSGKSSATLKKFVKLGIIRRTILNPVQTPSHRKSTYSYISS